MKTFTEFMSEEQTSDSDISEQAIARKGDWDFDEAHISDVSELIYKKDWTHKGYLKIQDKEFEIIKHNKENAWRLGNLIDNGEKKLFDTVFFLEMANSKNIGHKVNVTPLYRAKMVGVKNTLRGEKIAKRMYKFLVKEQKYNIIGDTEQFFGARKLWSSLSKDTDIQVDIIDTKKGEYVEKDVILHHGTDDWDFDKRIWDYSDHLEDIRLILKDIKL